MSGTTELQCDTSNFGVNDIRTLLLLVESPEHSVAITALESLTKYADIASKHRLQLLNFEIMNILLRLINSKELNLKKAAVSCLAATTEISKVKNFNNDYLNRCTLLDDIHPDMRRKEVIEGIIALLNTEEAAEVIDEAAFALANCAKDFGNKSQIRKSGGIKALVTLLDFSDPDVKKNAALALACILEDFTNRSEIRYVGGLSSLYDLLSNEFKEIQSNALLSIIRCAEDRCNRIEFRKFNAVKKLIDLLQPENSELHQNILLAIATLLEDSDIVLSFVQIAGSLNLLLKFLSSEDNKCKQYSSLAIGKAAKLQLTQIEIAKLGGIETMVKLLSHDNLEVNRQCVLALSSMCLNPKVRTRVKTLGLQTVTNLLNFDDIVVNINACECLINLAEDSEIRLEMAKNNGLNLLSLSVLKPDFKLQSSACLAIARCMNDGDCRIQMAKQTSKIESLVELLKSKDVNCCKNAALAISNACEFAPNALIACQSGAIESLISLISDTKRNSSRFAMDALENLLNHFLPAKYWLSNKLTKDNIIQDGFYDFGSAGKSLESLMKPFPSLSQLKEQKIDKKRETLLVDSNVDPKFVELCDQSLAGLSQSKPSEQIKHVAKVVSQHLGGFMEDKSKLSLLGYKFHITEAKMQQGENVLQIGNLKFGTFYHRALLFKAICDKIGLSPCTLIRGEYNRCWNEVCLSKMALLPSKPATPAATKVEKTSSKPGSREKEVRGGSGNTDKSAGKGSSDDAGPNSGKALNAFKKLALSQSTASTIPPPETFQYNFFYDEQDTVENNNNWGIVDLMFNPGEILRLGSSEARDYTRISSDFE
ncbi:Armadillo repeat-containing protein 3 [Clydaea vesicula]|uniref:Armadillo repeat-containing protein 3 n=1 Tax=Clydaea vesicula TaxID=447962 RepID=A0AAD5U645_9FUNG|nr:Armadillo repeat-containing protein 3 [Clydaea vesicula]